MAVERKSELLALGAEAPDFTLPATDGRNYSLSQLKNKARAVVVVFVCNHCPYVQAYEDRMIQLCKDFAEKGAAFLVINANDEKNYPEDSFAKMKERAKAKQFPYPYLIWIIENISLSSQVNGVENHVFEVCASLFMKFFNHTLN